MSNTQDTGKLTAEQTYVAMSLPHILDKHDKKIQQFSYDDMIEFANNHASQFSSPSSNKLSAEEVSEATEILKIELEHCKDGYRQDEAHKGEYSKKVLHIKRALKILSSSPLSNKEQEVKDGFEKLLENEIQFQGDLLKGDTGNKYKKREAQIHTLDWCIRNYAEFVSPSVKSKEPLKPLSEITDEDAIEATSLLGFDFIPTPYKNEKEFVIKLFSIGEKATHKIHALTIMAVYQHLQSKGYELPVYFSPSNEVREERVDMDKLKYYHEKLYDIIMDENAEGDDYDKAFETFLPELCDELSRFIHAPLPQSEQVVVSDDEIKTIIDDYINSEGHDAFDICCNKLRSILAIKEKK